jgi:hypothetical protein
VKHLLDPNKGTRTRNAALAIFAVAIFGGVAAHAGQADNILLVAPTSLPASSREYAEAMMLHETPIGKMYLYIEQQQGLKLTVLDVTNPARIRAEQPVALAASGPFDFVSEVGTRAELIRFRGTGEEAVLDLHRAQVPSLSTLPELTVTAHRVALETDGMAHSNLQNVVLPPVQYHVLNARVQGVKQEITNEQTGTTFLLAEDGLYVVRRPAIEASLDQAPTNSGG